MAPAPRAWSVSTRMQKWSVSRMSSFISSTSAWSFATSYFESSTESWRFKLRWETNSQIIFSRLTLLWLTFGTRFASPMPAAPGGVSAIISIAWGRKRMLTCHFSHSQYSKSIFKSLRYFSLCERFFWRYPRDRRTTWKLGWWFRFREKHLFPLRDPPWRKGIRSPFACMMIFIY